LTEVGAGVYDRGMADVPHPRRRRQPRAAAWQPAAATRPARALRPAVATSLVLAALAAGCAPRAQPRPPLPPVAAPVAATPATVGMDARLPARVDSIVRAALADGAAPGAAVAIGRWGRIVHLRGYGRTDWAQDAPAVDAGTVYDLASLTKVVGTTTAAMLLEEEDRLDIERPVADYLPELAGTDKAGITVRQLLTHSGGLEAFAPLFREFRGREAYLAQIVARPLAAEPGTRTVYSDWDFILLQLVVERLTGQPLDRFLEARVFGPLGMRDTRFAPPEDWKARVAPTEIDTMRGGKVWGFVHDENAWALGGVAGHAGLFSSARDLATFAHVLLAGGLGTAQIVRPQTVARWTARQDDGASRALGWDTPSGSSSAGRYFSPRSFGHTGFTGTSIWMDPERGLFVVLLTNRVNPTRDNQKHVALRRAVADAAQRAILDAPLIDWESRRQ
jgi:CubicO group peptidase (beta-lactamase class C family)